jgi:hypothetical protein
MSHQPNMKMQQHPRSKIQDRIDSLIPAPFARGAALMAVLALAAGSAQADLTNGGFETGDLTGWASGWNAPPSVTTDKVHSGTYAAKFTDANELNCADAASIVVPPNATLSYWVYRQSTGGGLQMGGIRSGGGYGDGWLTNWGWGGYNDSDWVQYTVDLSPYVGQTISLMLATLVDGSGTSTMWLDDVSLLIPATYDSWAFSRGLPAMSAGGDFDGDGISNLVEYALGLTPTVPNKPAGALTGRLVSFSKGAEAVANGDVTYAIEESDDLGATDPWTAVTSYTTNNSTTISYTLPAGKTKTFARMRVIKSP